MINPETVDSRPNFLNIFNSTIASISPIPENEQEERARQYQEAGITKLKRELAAIILFPGLVNNIDYEIWAEDIEDIFNPSMPHEEMREQLKNLFNIDIEYRAVGLGVFILQDNNDKLHLLVTESQARALQSVPYGSTDVINPHYAKVLDRYGIDDVIGRFRTERQEELSIPCRCGSIIKIIATQKDMLGARREDLYYVDLARRNDLTINEYIRTRLLAKSALWADIAFDAETYAKETAGNKIAGQEY